MSPEVQSGQPRKDPVLITGGAGYIGSHVTLACRDAGYPVVVLDNLSTGCKADVPAEVALVRGDAGDPDLVGRTLVEHQVGAVVHLAASTSVPGSIADPLDHYHNNGHVTASLLRACVERNVRKVVFSSSAAVYGEPGADPVSEDFPTAPLHPYGRSKLVSEWALRDSASAHDLRYVVIRCFNVAGADPDGRAGPSSRSLRHLVRVAGEVAVGLRDHMTLFGTDHDTPDGTCIRDYIHVSDVARAFVKALHHLEVGEESLVVNCGRGRGTSVREILEAVEILHGAPLTIREGSRRAGDPAALVADISRIRTTLAWTPRIGGLETILRTALAWERRRIDP